MLAEAVSTARVIISGSVTLGAGLACVCLRNGVQAARSAWGPFLGKLRRPRPFRWALTLLAGLTAGGLVLAGLFFLVGMFFLKFFYFMFMQI